MPPIVALAFWASIIVLTILVSRAVAARDAKARAEMARSLGLTLEGQAAHGEYRGRRVQVWWVTKGRSRWVEVGAALGAPWPEMLDVSRNFFGATRIDGATPNVRRLFSKAPLAEALSGLMATHTGAYIHGNTVVTRVGQQLSSAALLGECLDGAVDRARRLEESFKEALAVEQKAVAKWTEALAEMGLRIDGGLVFGTFRDVDVRLERMGADDDGPARLVASLGPGLPRGLSMHKRSRVDPSNGLVHLGDAELDERLRVDSEEAERAQALLRHADTSDALRRLFASHEDAVIQDGALVLELPRWRIAPAELSAHLDELCPLVFAIQQHTEWPEKREAVVRRRARTH